ncbi:MAG: hypothetical protein ACI308_03920 [Muribaculaceae bacterium]
MKKIFQHIVSGIMLTAIGAFAASCSDDNENKYEPASPVSSDNIGAYFPDTNSNMVMRADDDEKVVDVIVARTNTQQAAQVPIHVVSKTDNITCPDVANFAAGEAQTTIQVTYADLTTTPKCEIMIDEQYGNPYTIKHGSTHLSFSVYKLNLLSNNIKVVTSSTADTDYFSGVTGQAIYQLGNDNRFIWRNFLGSGIDLQFKLEGTFDSNDVHNSQGALIPIDHYLNDEYGWAFMQEENPSEDSENYVAWTPEGSSTPINKYIYFYYVYEGYTYFYMDFRKYGSSKIYSYGMISSAVVDSETNFNSYYVYIYY